MPLKQESDNAFVKLTTQKMNGMTNWHPCEERDDIKAD